MAMFEKFLCDGLCGDWDSCEGIRQRLRGGGYLLVGTLNGKVSNIAECIQNSDVLAPACDRLRASQGKLPDIVNLREQVMLIYKENSRVVDDNQVDDNAWRLRGMLRFVKRKAQRKDVSLAPRPKCLAPKISFRPWTFKT